MPAFVFNRQPDALAWFGNGRGQALLAAEMAVAGQWLVRRPAQPVLWLTPAVSARPALPDHGGGRHVWLWRQRRGFAGDLRCRLPLPLPNEVFGSVLVQHVAEEAGAQDLLSECARVLAPGGRLRLFSLNPFSPYRLHWRGTGVRVCDVAGWQAALRRAGLHPVAGSVTYLGPVLRRGAAVPRPVWPQRLRAVCVMEAEKRVAALIPSASLRRNWKAGAAPA